MKTIYKILSVILLISFSACNNEEYFELENPVLDPWLNVTDMDQAPIGAYYALSGNGGSRTIFGGGRLGAELYADGVALAPEGEGYGVNADAEDVYKRTPDFEVALYDNHIFNSAYFAIGNANGPLDFIEENNGNPFPLEDDQENVDRIRGELLFVRAYAYYWLARMYLPAFPDDEKRLPLRLDQANSYEEAIVSDLASANDLYPIIIQDLKDAKDFLPETFNQEIHPSAYADGRATKFAAAALLAKVLFHTGDYDGALAELNYVIDENDGKFDLSEDPIEAFNKTGIDRGKEVIWYYALWAGDGLTTWKHPGRPSWYNATKRNSFDPADNGDRFVRASDSFLEAAGWINPDLSETTEALQDKRYTQLFIRFEDFEDEINPEPRGAYEATRPYVWGWKYYRSDADRSTNIPILRLADMYLLRAIIRANNGDEVGSLSDLNTVRNRAGLMDFTGSGDDLKEAIHLERWKEMAFEGDRLYYLQGLEMDIPEGDRTSGAVPFNSAGLYSEIPDYEIDLNQGYSVATGN